jgi:hypothetical protein
MHIKTAPWQAAGGFYIGDRYGVNCSGGTVLDGSL